MMIRSQQLIPVMAVLVSLGAMLASPTVSRGDFLVEYSIAGRSLEPTVAGDAVDASDITLSGDMQLHAYQESIIISGDNRQADFASAVANNDYFSLTIGPAGAGGSITFDSFSVGVSDSPGVGAVQSSVGGVGAESPVLGDVGVYGGKTLAIDPAPCPASVTSLRPSNLRLWDGEQ